ncbi:hypothetical protein ALP24_05638 [Pseudomonas syringae pv. aptata]|uniref:Uncharacterized protein n=1 Tax=Pseudomonas syringae pv. aptata TaxID=83167 RepID=A0A3M5WM72_PSEAP|nr:hypothetical protein ALP24_05638 [Pseudomonas syringae pv. aptata]
MSSASSSLSSHTPRPPSRALSACACSRHSASGTIRSSQFDRLSKVVSLGNRCQVSSMTSLFLMIRCIDALLERVNANTLVGVDETLVFGPFFNVDVDQLLDHVRHRLLRKGGAENLAQARVTAGAAAKRDLIELFTFLVHAQHADMADMVVPAGVHAAGDIQVQLADIEQVVQIVETTLDGFGDRDRLGIGQRAEITARAADDVGQKANVRCGKTIVAQLVPQGEQLTLLDIGKDDVLLVRGAQLTEAVAIGQVGDGVQLLVGHIARSDASWLERQGHGNVARLLVRQHIALTPASEAGMLSIQRCQFSVLIAECLVLRVDEVPGHALHFGFGQGGLTATQVSHFSVDLGGKYFRGQRLDQNLDSRLVLVVATAIAVVDPQDGVQVAQQVLPRQELIDEGADDRCTAKAATHQNAEAQLARFVAQWLEADVMHFDGCAVTGRTIDRNLELTRQVSEFRVEGGPLTDDLAPWARVYQFICRHTGKLVGGDVAQAVAAGLDSVHLHGGQFSKNIGNIFKCRPVELYVLTGTDVRVAFIVVARNFRHHARLARGQLTVGYGDAQHWREALNIKTVLQAQRSKLFFAQFPAQVASGLIPELLDAVLDDLLIVIVVYVHIGPVLRLRHEAGQWRQSGKSPLLVVPCFIWSILRARPRTPRGAKATIAVCSYR